MKNNKNAQPQPQPQPKTPNRASIEIYLEVRFNVFFNVEQNWLEMKSRNVFLGGRLFLEFGPMAMLFFLLNTSKQIFQKEIVFRFQIAEG